MLDTPKELEINVAENWLSTGAIWPTWYGNENTYYINEFGHQFFCKNYPELYGFPEYAEEAAEYDDYHNIQF